MNDSELKIKELEMKMEELESLQENFQEMVRNQLNNSDVQTLMKQVLAEKELRPLQKWRKQ